MWPIKLLADKDPTVLYVDMTSISVVIICPAVCNKPLRERIMLTFALDARRFEISIPVVKLYENKEFNLFLRSRLLTVPGSEFNHLLCTKIIYKAFTLLFLFLVCFQ